MQTFLMGSLGALAAMAVLAVGAVIGWKAHAKFCQAKAEPLGEKERHALEEENKAFQYIRNYNTDMAYNLGGEHR